jgi:outer membrane protein OmpA-like peptidoglycan-associated protein
MQEPQPELVVILEFEPLSSHLNGRASWLLMQQLVRLREASAVIVIGHADASGPDELNARLSAERAAAVARRLVNRGMARESIRVEARGESEPRPEGNSRRVEIYVGEKS